MKMFSMLPKSLHKIFKEVTHLACNLPGRSVVAAVAAVAALAPGHRFAIAFVNLPFESCAFFGAFRGNSALRTLETLGNADQIVAPQAVRSP